MSLVALLLPLFRHVGRYCLSSPCQFFAAALAVVAVLSTTTAA